MMTTIRLALLAAGAALTVSCASTSTYRPVRLSKSEYPKLPDARVSAKMRTRAQVDFDFKLKFFWGNYGGPGDRGGRPVDKMDWLFYEHDVAYLQGVSLRELRKSDRTLIRELKAIDPGSLTLLGRAYRKRAILYFRLPISRWVGKPTDVLLRKKQGPTVVWIDEGK